MSVENYIDYGADSKTLLEGNKNWGSFIIKNKQTHLFERKMDREKTIRRLEVFHLLLHSLNASLGLGQAVVRSQEVRPGLHVGLSWHTGRELDWKQTGHEPVLRHRMRPRRWFSLNTGQGLVRDGNVNLLFLGENLSSEQSPGVKLPPGVLVPQN